MASRRSPHALGYDYRIVDSEAWKSWLKRIAGYPTTELEVVHRTLRVRDQGMAAQLAETTPGVREITVATTVPQIPPTSAPVAAKLTQTPTLIEMVGKPETEQGVVKSAPSAIVKPEPNGNVPPAPEPEKEIKADVAPVSTKERSSDDSVQERILALVVEKTGYPKDMLDLDLDLEADLGVDTVKQAEMFAAIREIYSIPRDENRKLRDYPTLAHVIRFVYEKRPDLVASSQVSTATQQKPEVAAASVESAISEKKLPGDSVQERILALVVEKTGYPKDMLDLDLDLEADLGVDTVKQAEMFAAIREIYNIPRDENRKLRDYPTLAHVIRFVYEKRPDLDVSSQASTATERKSQVDSRLAGASGHRKETLRRLRARANPGPGGGKDRISQGHAGPRSRS